MGIYVWGTGCGASELIEKGLSPEKITAFVESKPDSANFLGCPVLPPEEVPVSDCELMIVTTRHAEEIAQKCEKLGIPAQRCLFLKNCVSLSDRNAASRNTAYHLLGKELAETLLPRQHIIPTPGQLRDTRLSAQEQENDYVRLATLELLCRRLDQVPGAAAELGVYRGQFARCINRLLPDRTLYLFDSFQGFDKDAGAGEAMQAAHEKTSAEAVLAVMPYPEKIVLKPGFFPDSLDGLEEIFCFVSLDVDFEAATLAGLTYFWPRLSPGGHLMLHDWGNPGLPGPARALERYQKGLGQRLPAVPIPDLGGTLVLCKI
ncbi:MAG: TylF/MycF/NovP-related O-methyltransferase [Eubacteriales bacterium]|nr:TylF/MycF/NovP-related O-methyltransferase [Eubacteriales bacterium]